MSDGPSGNYAENDIYTALLIIASGLLVLGTIVVATYSQQLFGSWNPFSGV